MTSWEYSREGTSCDFHKQPKILGVNGKNKFELSDVTLHFTEP